MTGHTACVYEARRINKTLLHYNYTHVHALTKKVVGERKSYPAISQ